MIKKLFISLALMLSMQALWANDIEIINIENPAVQAYMADSTYFYHTECDTTVVPQYVTQGDYKAGLDYPAGKYVTWTRTVPIDSIESICISVSTNEDFNDAFTFYPLDKKDTSYTIRNLFPDYVYYYKVEEKQNNGKVTSLTSGVFRTVGQVRMIRVHGAHNVRDLGGWPTSFGVPIKYGLLYRSGNLDRITSTGIHDFVDNLGVGAELDLRAETKNTSSPMGEDIEFIRIVNDSYVGALAGNKYRDAYVRDFEWIVERLRNGTSVDWHCAVGCDRCGTVSFLIEGVLGVSEVDLSRDYELSSFRGYKRYRTHKGFRQLIPFMKKWGKDGDDLAQCFYNYLVHIGVKSEDIEFLRDTMLGNTDFVPAGMVL